MRLKFIAVADANAVALVVSGTGEACQELNAFLNRGQGEFRFGGKQHSEIQKSGEKTRQWLRTGIGRGLMAVLNEKELESETCQLAADPNMESDDPHMIALAVKSGARLLISRDAALGRDFKKKYFIDDPRGKLFPLEENANRVRKFLQRGGMFSTDAI